jgi:PRTRC genetic system protein A
MNKLVGYLVNHPEGLVGEKGLYYNYITASNGLFIEAESRFITARIPIAKCDVRGLAPLEKKISLLYGSIPQRFFDLSLNLFLSDVSIEHYVAVIADAGYKFYVPVQDRSDDKVVYQTGENVVLELHSHGAMSPGFSDTDNKDETGLKLYGVIGRLDKKPLVRLRIGIYGYFHRLSWKEVFDGSLTGADEYSREEVSTANDLLHIFRPHVSTKPYHPGWLRWHRGFRR